MDSYKCSRCKQVWATRDSRGLPFCPSCGAPTICSLGQARLPEPQESES